MNTAIFSSKFTLSFVFLVPALHAAILRFTSFSPLRFLFFFFTHLIFSFRFSFFSFFFSFCFFISAPISVAGFVL